MNKLYKKLPYPIKFILVNIYSYMQEKRRYKAGFKHALKFYQSVDFTERYELNIDKIKESVSDNSYYHLKSVDDFYNLPIINKEMIKKDYDRIINKNHLSTFIFTGGTTGSGLKFPVSQEFINHQWALFWKFRILHGIGLNTWCAYLIGKTMLKRERKTPPFWVKSFLSRQLLLSLPHLNSGTIKLFLEQIKKNNIRWIHGYPSALNLMTQLIKEQKLERSAKELGISVITTSSEILYQYQKENIEEIFGCKVRQLYGLTEGVANIFECEEGNLHVDETFSYVEFIEDQNLPGYCKIVGTSYNNKAFPLLRYDTGDSVLLPDAGFSCRCGRKSRVVKEIIGREQDYLIMPDYTKRVRIGSIIFRELTNVKKAQIIQRHVGRAEFYIVKGPAYNSRDEKTLLNNIENYLGGDFKADIIYTDTLQVSKNGKIRLIINELDYDSLLQKTESDKLINAF